MERATIFYSDKSRWTDNELMSLPRDGRKYELIEGELLMSPMGATHSLVCLNLATLLIRFAGYFQAGLSRTGVPPVRRTRQRERFYSAGFADLDRRDACPTLSASARAPAGKPSDHRSPPAK